MRTTAALGAALLTAGAAHQLNAQQSAGVDPRPPNATNQRPAFEGQARAPERKSNVAFDVVTFAEGLDKPWSLAFLPSGEMLVTEKGGNERGTVKPGQLRIVSKDGKLSAPATGLPATDTRNQGGLLDVVLAPQFQSSHEIYWC